MTGLLGFSSSRSPWWRHDVFRHRVFTLLHPIRLFVVGACLHGGASGLQAQTVTNAWVGGDGSWHIPAKWSQGVVPDTNTIVDLGVNPDVTVTHSQGDSNVMRIVGHAKVVVTGGQVVAPGGIQVLTRWDARRRNDCP